MRMFDTYKSQAHHSFFISRLVNQENLHLELSPLSHAKLRKILPMTIFISCPSLINQMIYNSDQKIH